MGSKYSEVKQHLVKKTKRLAKERYGVNVKVRVSRIPQEDDWLNPHSTKRSFTHTEAHCSVQVFNPTKSIISATITYDEYTFSVLVNYPDILETIMEHELAHIGAPGDGHGTEWKAEFDKYCGTTGPDIASTKYNFNYQDYKFWITAKREKPTIVDRITGFIDT